MINTGLVKNDRLRELFAQIEPGLIRFPAIEAKAFRASVERVCVG
jgi:hypothetical protein